MGQVGQLEVMRGRGPGAPGCEFHRQANPVTAHPNSRRIEKPVASTADDGAKTGRMPILTESWGTLSNPQEAAMSRHLDVSKVSPSIDLERVLGTIKRQDPFQLARIFHQKDQKRPPCLA